ncbi:hypothetical protein D3C80_1409250 [compost metagenome]
MRGTLRDELRIASTIVLPLAWYTEVGVAPRPIFPDISSAIIICRDTRYFSSPSARSMPMPETTALLFSSIASQQPDKNNTPKRYNNRSTPRTTITLCNLFLTISLHFSLQNNIGSGFRRVMVRTVIIPLGEYFLSNPDLFFLIP